jgi:predicted deacylase
MKSIPYVLIDSNPGSANKQAYEKAKTVTKKSGFLVVLETSDVERSLSYSLLQHNIPALTIELGESYVVNEKNVEYGVKSILSILDHLGMIKVADEIFSFQLPNEIMKKPLKFSFGPVSSASGIIRFLAKPGDIVKSGQVVAKIYNTFGKLQDTIRCANDGVVLGHSDSSVAFPGAPVMAFGII